MAIQFPASPTNGQVYQGYYYDSNISAWKASPVSAGPVAIADVAPTGAIHGDMWYNSLDGSSYIYVNDGTSSQWVEVHSNTAALPGSIIQTVSSSPTLSEYTTSTSLVTSTYYISITPKLATSKILIMMNFVIQGSQAVSSGIRLGIGRSYGSGSVSDIYLGDDPAHHDLAAYSNNWSNNHHRVNLHHIDSPATNGEVRYYVRFGSYSSSLTAALGNGLHSRCNFTLMEVAQ